MNVTIELSVGIAIVLYVMIWGKGPESHSRSSVAITTTLALILGLLLVGTRTGAVILTIVQQMVAAVGAFNVS